MRYEASASTSLAPAPIVYQYYGTGGVNITTGSGTGTINVMAAGAPTSITDWGSGTVNVGNFGSVQGILDPLTIEQDPFSPSLNTLNVDDSNDATARTAMLSTNGGGWGTITGLAPATITYSYSTTLNVTTGAGADWITVAGTGVPTNIIPWGESTTIIVGNGSVQGILGALTIQGIPDGATNSDHVVINDSEDITARAAYVNSSWDVNGNHDLPDDYDFITGLAPAKISVARSDAYQIGIKAFTTFPTTVKWYVSEDASVFVAFYDDGILVD